MSGVHPPLTYADIVKILKALGFSKRDHKGTSHEQWVNQNPFRKVTVDKPKSPFSHILIASMAKQAGATKSDFYAALKK